VQIQVLLEQGIGHRYRQIYRMDIVWSDKRCFQEPIDKRIEAVPKLQLWNSNL
jgi:hypothetical protein